MAAAAADTSKSGTIKGMICELLLLLGQARTADKINKEKRLLGELEEKIILVQSAGSVSDGCSLKHARVFKPV
jgi:hypothetical protein